jgi:hypothetical protein
MYKHAWATGIIYRRIRLKDEIIHHEQKKMGREAIVANFKMLSQHRFELSTLAQGAGIAQSV